MPYTDFPTLESNCNRDHIRDSVAIANFPAEFAESFLRSGLPPAEVARLLLATLSLPVQ